MQIEVTMWQRGNRWDCECCKPIISKNVEILLRRALEKRKIIENRWKFRQEELMSKAKKY